MVMEDVPLFSIPHVMMQGICRHGEEVEWLEAKRANRHFYMVRVRTRPVNREFQRRRARAQAKNRRRGG
jgi:hypothetical protein